MLSSKIIESQVKNKCFPYSITGNEIIKRNVELKKIFPKIGLSNSKEPIKVDLDITAVHLGKVIHLAIKKFIDSWRAEGPAVNLLKGLELLKMSKTIYVLEELNRRFNKDEGVCHINNKVVLTTSIPSYDGKPLIRNGADVFKLTKQLLENGSKYVHVDLLSTEEILKQCKNLEIVFSSEDLEGAWDIATMSMRGVKSCMRWEAKQSVALAGSIIDPCCGIIYLTNGVKTSFGSKMLFRAVVRLIINRLDSSPALFVDRIYSSFYKNRADETGKFDKQISEVFVKYLQEKVVNCPVFDGMNAKLLLTDYILPRTEYHTELSNLGQLTYRDTPISYSYYDISNYMTKIVESVKIKHSKKINKSNSKKVKS